jgi:hypothetical protein
LTTVESRWAEMKPGKGFQRIDENHPLDFYLGLDVSGERVLLLVTEENVDVSTQSQAIQVLIRQRQDGRWALMFKLTKPELSRIFSHLCEDIIEYGRKLRGTANPAESVIKRFMHWQRLLERSQSGLLDLVSQRGLLGELLFLQYFALHHFSLMQAVEGWEGPLDAAQDFQYTDRAFEIKTLGLGANEVKISSAEQLDNHGLRLQLVAVMLATADNQDGAAFTLPDIVDALRKKLESDTGAYQLFEERLLAIGYFDHEEYRSHKYNLERFRFFDIRDEFPRIIRACLPGGIGKVIYEVDLAFCQPYEITQMEGMGYEY